MVLPVVVAELPGPRDGVGGLAVRATASRYSADTLPPNRMLVTALVAVSTTISVSSEAVAYTYLLSVLITIVLEMAGMVIQVVVMVAVSITASRQLPSSQLEFETKVA